MEFYTRAEAIVSFFFPVNKGNLKEKEENKQNRKEISTTMKSSTALQQSCARGPRELFLFVFSEQSGE